MDGSVGGTIYMRQSKKTVFVYALPPEMVPADATQVVTNTDYGNLTVPFVVARHQPNTVVEARLSMVKAWFDETLAAEDGTGIIEATMALPALSLFAEYWADAIDKLKKKLDELNIEVVRGPLFTPHQLGINITTKYLVADWYGKFSSGLRQDEVVEYRISRPQKKSNVAPTVEDVEKPRGD